jgi:hypothetical protein
LLILWIPAFSRRLHGQPDNSTTITRGIFPQRFPPRPCRWNQCGGEKQRSCGDGGRQVLPKKQAAALGRMVSGLAKVIRNQF